MDGYRNDILDELTETLGSVRDNAFTNMSDEEIKSSTKLFSDNIEIVVNGFKMSNRYIPGKAAKALIAKNDNDIDSGRRAAEYLEVGTSGPGR